MTVELKFRNNGQILTLWVERKYEDGWATGWCPELKQTMSVHPENVTELSVSFPKENA